MIYLGNPGSGISNLASCFSRLVCDLALQFTQIYRVKIHRSYSPARLKERHPTSAVCVHPCVKTNIG